MASLTSSPPNPTTTILRFAPADLAAAILRAAQPDFRERAGESNPRRACEHSSEKNYEAVLKLYRKVLAEDGQIHFKTDNDKLFAWSLEEIPQFGFRLSEVTTDLHRDGPVGVMTDYERKFFSEGKNINRCVATMVPWEEPEAPADEAEAE